MAYKDLQAGADRARDAIEAHNGGYEAAPCFLKALLSDLMHYAAREGVDWSAALAGAAAINLRDLVCEEVDDWCDVAEEDR